MEILTEHLQQAPLLALPLAEFFRRLWQSEKRGRAKDRASHEAKTCAHSRQVHSLQELLRRQNEKHIEEQNATIKTLLQASERAAQKK
jgi:hypothetical protein